MTKINCFKAYDVRGRVPEELDEDIAYRIGRGYAAFVKPRVVAVGRDIRASSPMLTAAIVKGLTDSGVDVLDIGVGGTELSYFATFSRKLDGGIMVTASHNPPNYNGMKFVREGSRPISADTGLQEIRALAERNAFGPPVAARGKIKQVDIKPEYIEHLLSYVDLRRSRRSRSSSMPATAARGRSSTCSSRICRSASSRYSTSPTAASRTACRTR